MFDIHNFSNNFTPITSDLLSRTNIVPREYTDQYTPYRDGCSTNCNINSSIKINPGRAIFCNLLLCRQTPCPLGHRISKYQISHIGVTFYRDGYNTNFNLPDSSPNTDIIPFPNKDSAVVVAAVPGFSFGLDFILLGSWKILLILYVILKELKLNKLLLGVG